jgi:hypothetical protein
MVTGGPRQSETLVLPKVDFETYGPKAVEDSREIVSETWIKNASATNLGKEAIIRPIHSHNHM